MHRLVLIGLCLLLLSPPLFGQLSEQGSLRSFVLGSDTALAYDNWHSHTVEGIAEPGYNAYLPDSLDPQTTGFGAFQYISESAASAYAAQWDLVFEAAWHGNLSAAQQLLDSPGFAYDVVSFLDTETGRDLVLLRERLDSTHVDPGPLPGEQDDVTGSFQHGWGLFVLNPDASLREVMVHVVHPNDDFAAVPLATDLFLRGDLGALAIHGTGREVLWNDEGGDYSNSLSLSDPSRNPNLPMQWFVQHFVEQAREENLLDLTIQFHSFDSESHEHSTDLIVSPGSADGYANRPSFDRSGAGLSWANHLPLFPLQADQVLPGQTRVRINDYISFWYAQGLTHQPSGYLLDNPADLPGYSGNRQMLAVMEGLHPRASHDRFLHVEVDELPDGVEAVVPDYLAFYDARRPPGLATWEHLLEAYRPAQDALIACLQEDYLVPDTTAPQGPTTLMATAMADTWLDLSWDQASDPDFDGYRVVLDTTSPPGPGAIVLDRETLPDLVDPATTELRAGGLEPGRGYEIQVLGTDLSDNQTESPPTLTATPLDTTVARIGPYEPLAVFPRGAWPPELTLGVSSTFQPESVRVHLRALGSPWTTIVPLQPRLPWQPDQFVPYVNPEPATPGPLPPTDRIIYWFEVVQGNYLDTRVRRPAQGHFELTLVDGTHLFEANLEADSGGLAPLAGDSLWHWGTPPDGPGGGSDGDHAWYAFHPQPGSLDRLLLDLPELATGGHNGIYLRFQTWFELGTSPYQENLAHAGGRVEYSLDGGGSWQAALPVGGYPCLTFDGNADDYFLCFGGSSGGWVEASMPLPGALEAEHLSVRFVLNGWQPNDETLGWALDNITLTSFAPQPETPLAFRITRYDDGRSRLQWNPGTADFYRIYRSDSPLGPYVAAGRTTGEEWVDGPPPGEEGARYYRVTAVLR